MVETVIRSDSGSGNRRDSENEIRPAPAHPTAVGPTVGSVLAIDGSVVIGQLGDRASAGPEPVEIGQLVRLSTARWPVYGVVHALRRGRRADDKSIVEVHLLGEITMVGDLPRFLRGVSASPTLDAMIQRATSAEEAVVYAQPTMPSIEIGRLRHDPTLPAHLVTDRLLGNHLAVLGSTGSGKSCAVTVLLRAIVDKHPHAHVVLLDPHAEYGAAFGDRASCLDPTTLQLPYWLMSFDELAAVLVPGEDGTAYVERGILEDMVLRAKQRAAGEGSEHVQLTVDTPVPYRLTDLVTLIDEDMGSLDKPDGAAPYRHLLNRIEQLRNDRRYAFLFPSLYLKDSMADILGQILRMPVEGKPITTIDISGIPSEITDMVVSFLCRLVFEFGLWSVRERTRPVLLVCEEAHRYVPAAPAKGFEPSRQAIDRIAKEGRKYGISLCLVSQRPADLSASSLSQCGTIMALRMSNERDQAFIREVLPDGSEWLIRSLPALTTGEAVVMGEGATVPVQIELTRLPADQQPSSQTPSFSDAWSRPMDDAREALVDTVGRWRAQQR